MGFIIHPRLVIRKHQSRAHVQWALATTAVVISCLLLPGDAQGRGSLAGCRPWGREEPDTTERLPSHFSLSRIGEGHGSPLPCSCLENRRDGGAWRAAVCGAAQSRSRLKRLSSSSSSCRRHHHWKRKFHFERKIFRSSFSIPYAAKHSFSRCPHLILNHCLFSEEFVLYWINSMGYCF